MWSFAEFERALSRERQLEGIAGAEKRGVYTGRKKALTEHQVTEIYERARVRRDQGRAGPGEYGVSRETLYQHLPKVDASPRSMR